MLTDWFATAWNLRYDASETVNEGVGVFRGGDSSDTGYGMQNTYRLDKLSSVGGTYPVSKGAVGSTVADPVLIHYTATYVEAGKEAGSGGQPPSCSNPNAIANGTLGLDRETSGQ